MDLQTMIQQYRQGQQASNGLNFLPGTANANSLQNALAGANQNPAPGQFQNTLHQYQQNQPPQGQPMQLPQAQAQGQQGAPANPVQNFIQMALQHGYDPQTIMQFVSAQTGFKRGNGKKK